MNEYGIELLEVAVITYKVKVEISRQQRKMLSTTNT